jgi:hypothetical protein
MTLTCALSCEAAALATRGSASLQLLPEAIYLMYVMFKRKRQTSDGLVDAAQCFVVLSLGCRARGPRKKAPRHMALFSNMKMAFLRISLRKMDDSH